MRGPPRWSLAAAALLLWLAPATALAQPVDRYFFVGFSSGLGLELSGVKLFAGYNFGRGDVQVELYAGSLSLPPGPGAGLGLAGKYYLLDDPTWRAGVGGQLGLQVGAGIVPVAQLIGLGEVRRSVFGAYARVKTGVPQVFGAGLGGKVTFNRRTVWLEANTGFPLLVNGELGYSFAPF